MPDAHLSGLDRGERGGLSGDVEQLAERAEHTVMRGGFVEQLAQRLGEELGVDRPAQFILDLLEHKLHDTDFPDA